MEWPLSLDDSDQAKHTALALWEVCGALTGEKRIPDLIMGCVREAHACSLPSLGAMVLRRLEMSRDLISSIRSMVPLA